MQNGNGQMEPPWISQIGPKVNNKMLNEKMFRLISFNISSLVDSNNRLCAVRELAGWRPTEW